MATVRGDQLVSLARHSLELILSNQAASGAYIASPEFDVYRYCWLRDGAFIADAVSRAGEIESAEAFFAWCAGILLARRERVEDLMERGRAGVPIPTSDFLHARFTLDGREAESAWWNFQLDGYGAWLWALDAHARRHNRPIWPFVEGAALSARYVATFWDQPSYDWWEEHRDHRHTSTLAAIAAGLRAVRARPELPDDVRSTASATADRVVDAIRHDAARHGRLAKWLDGDGIDASLLAASTPFELLAPDEPLMIATVECVESQLVHGGGVHRYPDDSYYGGGEWLLLAALLGWHKSRLGDRNGAIAELEWIAAQATPSGELPEQVASHLLAPEARQAWMGRWGPVATPLLWSHAMYLTLAIETGVFDPARDRAGDPGRAIGEPADEAVGGPIGNPARAEAAE